MSDELNQSEREEFENLKKEKASKENKELCCRVSQKGAVSVYGLGKWPVTLYRGQFEKLIAFVPRIEKFIVDHSDQLKTKDS
jgi:hypothetical protein